jgi:hypothetical protein
MINLSVFECHRCFTIYRVAGNYNTFSCETCFCSLGRKEYIDSFSNYAASKELEEQNPEEASMPSEFSEPITAGNFEEIKSEQKKPEQALRFNSDKIEMSVQPYRAWAAFSTVCMLNSQAHGGKYPDQNWRKGALHSQYLDCASRHLAQHITGERIDPTDGAPHLWKVLWNIAMAVEDNIVHPENMDVNLDNPIDFSLFVDIIKAAKEKRKKE